MAIAVLLRIVSNPVANVFQKQLTNQGQHPLFVNFISYLLLSIVCVFLALFINWPVLTTTFWMYAILGGLAGAWGNGFLVKALQQGDLSVLGPINAYKSVIGIIVGIFLLREMPNLWGLVGIALIIYGSYFVLDTTAERFSWALLKNKEIQFRIWAMVLTAVEAVFIKKVIIASSTTIAFLSWCFFGALFSFLLLFIYRLPIGSSFNQIKKGNFSKYFLLVACIGIMQFTTNYTFNHMPVGYALSLFQLSIIVSIFLGYRIFNEKYMRKKILGSLIMIVGSVILILFKSN